MFFPVFKAQEQSAAAGEVDKGDCLLLTAYGVMCGPPDFYYQVAIPPLIY